MLFVYINLEFRKKKNIYMNKLLNSLKLKFERFNAVRPTLDEIKLLKNKHPYFNLSLSKQINHQQIIGVIGCYLSHLNVLKKYKLIESKYLVVLEDDVYFDSNSLKKLDKFLEYLDNNEDWDILRLIWNQHVNQLIYANKSFDNIKLLKFDSVNKDSIFYTDEKKKNFCTGGTHFQVINTKKIQKIINYLDKDWIYHIDSLLSNNILNIFAISSEDLNIRWNMFNFSDIPKK